MYPPSAGYCYAITDSDGVLSIVELGKMMSIVLTHNRRRGKRTPAVAAFVLMLGSALFTTNVASPQDCPTVVHERLEYARDPQLLLRDYDAIQAYTERVSTHADEVFIAPEKSYRQTLSAVLHTTNMLGDQSCYGSRDAAVGALQSHAGLIAAMEHSGLALGLSAFAVGRLDSALLTEARAEGEDVRFNVGLFRGLVGAKVQLTRWVSLSFARTYAGTTRDDDPYWDDSLHREPSAASLNLFEVGSPLLGLRGRLTQDGELLVLRELAARDVGLWESLRGSLTGRYLSTESRGVLVPELNYALYRGEGRALDVGLRVDVENAPVNLRSARLGVQHLLLDSGITRESFSRIGARIEQTAGLTLHRGNQMREASEADVAVGAEWAVLIGMQSPYIYLFFDFGVSFNSPEMLDLVPHAANSGMLSAGINLANKW